MRDADRVQVEGVRTGGNVDGATRERQKYD
jgi:hypothetical protein